jgi:hypothetical protein
MASPLRQEYSRLTDPGRYRIGPARARVWTEVLGAQPGISVAPLAPADLDDEGRLGRCDRGVRISSPRPGTLPVLLLTCDVRSASTPEPLPVVHICVVRPDVALTVQPSCGCDACDSGSDDLLSAIDDAIGQVVGGPFVALRAANWRANWHPEGANAEGTAPGLDFSALMGLCRRLAEGQDVPPPGAEVFIGHSWFE